MCDTSPLRNLSVMTNGLRRRSWLALPLVVALLAAGSLSLRAATPAETERKIEALLAKMTLQGKCHRLYSATSPTRQKKRSDKAGGAPYLEVGHRQRRPIQLTAAIPGLGAGVVTIEAKAAPRPESQ